MAKALKCDLCDNQATVHLTQILNNKVHKVDLCESCAEQKGVTDPNGFSLADLLIKSTGGEPAHEDSALKCPGCGYTQAQFRKTGRLGCPDCYPHFRKTIETILANMHKGVSHCGKVPANARAQISRREEIQRLEGELKKAVAAERYEDAAEYRDQIQAVKSAGDPEEGSG